MKHHTDSLLVLCDAKGKLIAKVEVMHNGTKMFRLHNGRLVSIEGGERLKELAERQQQ